MFISQKNQIIFLKVGNKILKLQKSMKTLKSFKNAILLIFLYKIRHFFLEKESYLN